MTLSIAGAIVAGCKALVEVRPLPTYALPHAPSPTHALPHTSSGVCESDGKTVTGVFPVLFGFYRPDRMVRPRTRLPMVPLSPELGWCDAPGHAAYNRPVALPFDASHERMWRDDGLYDVVLVPDVNVLAPVAGRGSALFIHIARPGYTPTEGCIAVSRRDMGLLLDRIGPETPLVVSV